MKTQMPGLRNRFARGVRLPLHLKLAGAIKQAISWDVPLEPEITCKSHGHKFDLKKWNGPKNYCEECGAWIKSHEQVRQEEYYSYR